MRSGSPFGPKRSRPRRPWRQRGEPTPVIVGRGIVRAGRVTLDGVSYRVRRWKEGAFLVSAPPPMRPGWVRYFEYRDRAVVSAQDENLEIHFHPATTTIGWRGRAYRLASMTQGRIRITEGDREVVRGRVTPSGIRLDRVAPELLPIIRELALFLGKDGEVRMPLKAGEALLRVDKGMKPGTWVH